LFLTHIDFSLPELFHKVLKESLRLPFELNRVLYACFLRFKFLKHNIGCSEGFNELLGWRQHKAVKKFFGTLRFLLEPTDIDLMRLTCIQSQHIVAPARLLNDGLSRLVQRAAF
jgi:hypothetical protein